jgi:hypothetical protein
MRRLLPFLFGAVAAVPVIGYATWRRASAGVARAVLSQGRGSPGVFTPDQLADLPEPVVRFFRRTLADGQPCIRTARFRQEGEFFMNGSWRPFRAEQVVAATPPAFMWDARIAMAPFMPVYVRDAYVAGRASMNANVLGIYPVVNQAGTPELREGALMRYLGEAAWLPTRLLPGEGLTWTPVDGTTARATLTDGPTTVSLQFRFDEQGDIVEVFAPERPREVSGRYVPTPWRVRALGHELRYGVRVMSAAEVAWILPDGPLPYWRGRLTGIEFTY